MKEEIKYFVWIFGLGAALVIYAQATFATRHSVRSVRDVLETIDQRVYDLHSKLITK